VGLSKRRLRWTATSGSIYSLRIAAIAASGFERVRAQSIKSAATGLKVRFFKVTIPTGRGGIGNSMGRALNPRPLPTPLKNDPGRIDRKRPVIAAPAGTPPAVIDKLYAAINETLESPGLKTSFAQLGMNAMIVQQRDLVPFVASEAERWPPIVKAAGLTPE
jgi:hypothetical protein